MVAVPMTDDEIKEATRKVHQWARFFEGLTQEPTTAALHDLKLIARYARYVEEDRGRWMLEADAWASGAYKNDWQLSIEGCWWYRLGKFLRLVP